MALSQTLGKLANKYVNFTVSTIFKCSKALPTMALMVLCGKRYTLANVAAALTMALSAFCFAVGARQADADFNFLGVLLNGLYLLFQAVHKSNYLHAIDATPARWRGDAGSSPLVRASTAASVHPTHWLISTLPWTAAPA